MILDTIMGNLIILWLDKVHKYVAEQIDQSHFILTMGLRLGEGRWVNILREGS